VIPHITDEIKTLVREGADEAEIAIVEIGGTVGDIESLPFLEAIRQLGLELGPRRSMYLHLTLVPFIAAGGELKTKPTQHSVKELRSIGIQPQVVVCRSQQPLPLDARRKIALFTSVPEPAVISAPDVDTIYRIPRVLAEQGLDTLVLEQFGLEAGSLDLGEWDAVVDAIVHPRGEVRIGMIGKYVNLADAYKSLNEALIHAGIRHRVKVLIEYIDSEALEQGDLSALEGLDAVLVPGGFGVRGVEGKIAAIRHAREQGVPYLGICLGMQLAVVEFARHQAGLAQAHSTEFFAATPHPVIALMTEWRSPEGVAHLRDGESDLGGTMRLGAQRVRVQTDSLAAAIYAERLDADGQLSERHRHRYEVNQGYHDRLEQSGLKLSGLSEQDGLVEIIELPAEAHPWFVACQFHPEFTSTPRDGHPLFTAFVAAAMAYRQQRA